MANRECYWVNEGFAERLDDGTIGYRIAVVTENEAGYRPDTSVYSKLELAKKRADHFNEVRGLTEEDVMDILASSMRVSRG